MTATDILIYGEIGDSWFWDDDPITGKSIAAALDNIPANTRINLRINSPGGDVGEALAIYNLLSERREYVTTYIDGYALSAASFIALAGHRVVSPTSSIWMLHNPHTVAFGDANAMRKTASILDTHREVLMSIYAERTGQDQADIIAALDEETWFTGTEAVEFGLATELSTVDLPEEAITNNWIPPALLCTTSKETQKKIAALGWTVPPRRRNQRPSFAAVFTHEDKPMSTQPQPQPQPQPPDNELIHVRAEVAELRASLTKTQGELEQTLEQLQAAKRRQTIQGEYYARRREAESLSLAGKLSKAQFDKLFSADAELDITALVESDRPELRLGRIEGALEMAQIAQATLQTDFAARDPIEQTQRRQLGDDTPTGETPAQYAERLVRSLPTPRV